MLRILLINVLNQHFIDVGPSLAGRIDLSATYPISYIKNSPNSSFVLSQVSETDVCENFSQLNPSKSSLDIPNKMVKIACTPLSKIFTPLFNESIHQGVVPQTLKISRVTPIYKSGVVTDPNNYRPISTLSPFSKTLERLVYLINYYLFFKINDILYKYQFGFRKAILQSMQF